MFIYIYIYIFSLYAYVFQGFSGPATCVVTLFPLADMRKPKLSAEIAKQLRKFHEVVIPGSKEPQLWHDIFKFFEKGFFFLISP